MKEFKYLNYTVVVTEKHGILEWNYNGCTWQTGPRQKKLNSSYFVRHVPKDRLLPLEIRDMMVNYHHQYYNNPII